MIPAIETQYKGYRFRSRTEARWAVFFDALGVDWVYEPEGYNLGGAGLYLPDFWLPLPIHRYANAGYFVEIKGIKPTEEYMNRLVVLARKSKHSVWCFVGEPGKQEYWSAHNSGYYGWSDEMQFRGDRIYATTAHFIGRWPHVTAELGESAVAAMRCARFEHGETPQVYR